MVQQEIKREHYYCKSPYLNLSLAQSCMQQTSLKQRQLNLISSITECSGCIHILISKVLCVCLCFSLCVCVYVQWKETLDFWMSTPPTPFGETVALQTTWSWSQSETVNWLLPPQCHSEFVATLPLHWFCVSVYVHFNEYVRERLHVFFAICN